MSFVRSINGKFYFVASLWFIEVFTARLQINQTLNVSNLMSRGTINCLFFGLSFGKLSSVEVTYLESMLTKHAIPVPVTLVKDDGLGVFVGNLIY